MSRVKPPSRPPRRAGPAGVGFALRLGPVVALALCLVAAALLTACGGTPTPSPGATPPAEAEAEATENPRALVWALEAAPQTLDPARIGDDPGARQATAQIYDRLLNATRNPDGSVGLAQGLAENWESDVSGTSYTFELREGLTFHDGTPLDAPAVKWNFERWMDPEHEAHDGSFRAWRASFGGFVGEEIDGRPTNLVERVEALDARTVRITLQAPFAPFPQHLATPAFGIASPSAVRAQGADYGSDAESLPVGSGPFRAVAWDEEAGRIRLEAFPEHWAGPPASPALRLETIEEPAERELALAEGRVHGADFPATHPVTGTLASGDLTVLGRPARSTSWIVLNHGRPPLGDVRVREAISLAIDRERLAKEAYGAFAAPAGQLLPPGFFGHVPQIAPPARDLERARALMAEAEVDEGFSLNLWTPEVPRPYLPDPRRSGEIIAENLAEINIDVNVRTEPLRRFLERRTSGRATSWLMGWQAQILDPDNFWYYHFSPSRAPAEGQYSNETLAALLLDGQREENGQVRLEAYASSAEIVQADVPRVFLAYVRPIVAHVRGLEGFQPGPLGFDDLGRVFLGGAPAGTPLRPEASATPTTGPTPESSPGTDDGEDGEDGQNGVEPGDGTDAAPDEEAGDTQDDTQDEAQDATNVATETAP